MHIIKYTEAYMSERKIFYLRYVKQCNGKLFDSEFPILKIFPRTHYICVLYSVFFQFFSYAIFHKIPVFPIFKRRQVASLGPNVCLSVEIFFKIKIIKKSKE